MVTATAKRRGKDTLSCELSQNCPEMIHLTKVLVINLTYKKKKLTNTFIWVQFSAMCQGYADDELSII